jgi:hypothetical protein
MMPDRTHAHRGGLNRRRLSDVVYRQLVADDNAATAALNADPGGHCGATQESSAADLPPHIDSNDRNQLVAVVTLTSTDVLLDCLGIVLSGRCGSRQTAPSRADMTSYEPG